MDIVQDRALLVRTRKPDLITEVIPKAEVVKTHDLGNGQRGYEVLVNWTLANTKIIRNLGIKNAPSPITRKYNWPGMYKPFAHQIETAGFLTLHQRCFCLNDMGTGKTMSTIWAADYLMSLGVIKRVLIVAPLSILDTAWRADLFKTAMHRRVDIAHGSREKRKAIIASDAEFVIINYDGIEVVHREIAAAGFDLIVCDESSALKNHQTKRWKLMSALLTPHTWLWLLTGTPAAQSPADAYGLAKLVSPQGVPRFFGAFRDKVMLKVSNFRYVPRPEAQGIVHRALQPAIRYTKEECLDLPEMTYVDREVPLTLQQQKYYDKLRQQLLVQAAGEDISAVNAAVEMNKLLQISSGCCFSDTGEVIEFDCSNRLSELTDIIEQSSHKTLVFANFTHSIETIKRYLTTKGVNCDCIYGAVSLKRRSELIDQFQKSPELQVLIIQPQAAAHGITLHAANTIVWWGPSMSVEHYLQANARVYRAGQKNPCTVVHLFGSNVEKKLYARLQSKKDDQESLLAMYKNILDNK